jgi:hypothetical protein
VRISNSSSSVPRPPGEGDEAVRELRHRGFALVHRAHDTQVGERVVRHFAVHQALWDDAGHLDPGRRGFLGDDAHQPDAGAAVHQPQPAPGEQPRHRAGGLHIGRVPSEARAEKDTDAFHGPAWWQAHLAGGP